MKTLLFLFILGVFTLSSFSCSDDEKEMEYAKIYFPLATRADANGIFSAKFDYTRDTTFIVRAYCAGSMVTPNDVTVNIELATNEFIEKQNSNPAFADYELLPEDSYSIDPIDLTLIIKKNTDSKDMKVSFETPKLTIGKKYILPLKIKSTSLYEISDKHSLLFFAIEEKK